MPLQKTDSEASDIAALPDDIQNYIKELREESKERREALQEYKELGDPDTVRRATELWNATMSEEGMQRIFNEAATSLGYDVQYLTEDQQIEVTEKIAEDMSGDETSVDIEELVRRTVDETVEPIRQESMEQRNIDAVHAALDALEVTNPQDRYDVLSYANQFVQSETPEGMKEAVQQGYTKWSERLDALGELAVQRYLEEKAENSLATPNPLRGSSTVSTVDVEPPKNTREFIKNFMRPSESETPV